MNITLCDKVLDGDIPSWNFKNKLDAIEFFYQWLGTKDFAESVFVCFASWKKLEIEELRNEQGSILVSHIWDDITDFAENYLDAGNFEQLDDLMDFAVFEFESYEEAFRYCIDLRESF